MRYRYRLFIHHQTALPKKTVYNFIKVKRIFRVTNFELNIIGLMVKMQVNITFGPVIWYCYNKNLPGPYVARMVCGTVLFNF